MTWHRSDDGFPEHPKCDALAEHFGDDWATCNVAFATWHHMGCDCAARRTDGVFNASRAHRVVRAPREVIDRALAGLLKVGLLDKHRDGFVFHDWAVYQPTRAELDAERAAKTERQKRWRENHPKNRGAVDGGVDASRDGHVDASTRRLTDNGRRVASASVDGGVDAAPSRPVPTRPDPEGESRAPAREEPTPSAHGPATTATGRSLLDAFRDATGSRATLVGNMAEERGLADMLARLAPTAAEVTAMGVALGEVAAWWPQGKRPAPKHVTLRDLAGFRGKDGSPEWGPLSALVAHVRAKSRPVDRKAALAAAMLSADPWVAAAARAGHLLHEEEA